MATKYPSSYTEQDIIKSKTSINSAEAIKRIRASAGTYEIVRKSPPPPSVQVKPSLSSFSDLEKQFHELKKQTDELRKQFELSQKQNEEYRIRLEKLEKEVRKQRE
jgi:predicted RNase H-like nuclease (RuvC/YqgF family)